MGWACCFILRGALCSEPVPFQCPQIRGVRWRARGPARQKTPWQAQESTAVRILSLFACLRWQPCRHGFARTKETHHPPILLPLLRLKPRAKAIAYLPSANGWFDVTVTAYNEKGCLVRSKDYEDDIQASFTVCSRFLYKHSWTLTIGPTFHSTMHPQVISEPSLYPGQKVTLPAGAPGRGGGPVADGVHTILVGGVLVSYNRAFLGTHLQSCLVFVPPRHTRKTSRSPDSML